MTFKNLRALGQGYKSEEGTEGHDRRDALGGLEAKLLEFYTHSDKARLISRGVQVATGAPSGVGRVKALTAFHMQQQQKSTLEERINLQIIKLRQWLHRQHARLMPDGRIDWSRSLARIQYDHDIAKQALTRVTVRGGLLVTANGRPFDTEKMVTMFSGPGNAIYVMSPDGHLHVSSHSVGYRHHSSLLAGASVGGAGEMCVRQGRIVWISNKSGHYTPAPINLLQTLISLARQGYVAHMRVVCMYADRSQRVFADPREFCIQHQFDDDVVSSIDVISAYTASQRDAASNAATADSPYSHYTAYSSSLGAGAHVYYKPQYSSHSSGYGSGYNSTFNAEYGLYDGRATYGFYTGPGEPGYVMPKDPPDLSNYAFYSVSPVRAPMPSLSSDYGIYNYLPVLAPYGVYSAPA